MSEKTSSFPRIGYRELFLLLVVIFCFGYYFFNGNPFTRNEVQWERIYLDGSQTAIRSILKTEEGYLLVGYADAQGSYGHSVYLVKTDAKGNKLWDKKIGEEYDAKGYECQPTQDGGYIIVGSASPLFTKYVYVIKTDEDGNLEWEKIFDEDGWRSEGFSIQCDPASGYIVAGVTKTEGSNAFLMKIDDYGRKEWMRTYGGLSYDRATSVRVTPDGGYIFVGDSESYGGGDTDVFLVKTDALGGLVWIRTFGGVLYEEGWCVQVCSDGGYVVSGETGSVEDRESMAYLLRVDEDGGLVWESTFGHGNRNRGLFVEELDGGRFAVCGFSSAENLELGTCTYVSVVDSEGSLVWDKVYYSLDEGIGWCVESTGDGGFLVAGERTSRGNLMKIKAPK